jgi:hypothetical protein
MPIRPLARRAICALVIAALCACTSMQPLRSASQGDGAPTPATALLKAGDTVRIRLAAGGERTLTVSEVRADSIVGRGEDGALQIALADIAAIERRQFDASRTALLVLGAAAIVQAARSVGAGLGRLLGP